MGSIRAKSLLLVASLLSACVRREASPEEARKAVVSCGMTVVEVAPAYGFDFAGTEIQVKKLPRDEFSHKITCVDWKLFFNGSKRVDITIENGPYDPRESEHASEFNSSFTANLSD